MTTLHNPMLITKLGHAIKDLSGQAQPQGAVERQKMIAFFQSVNAECQHEALAMTVGCLRNSLQRREADNAEFV